MTAQEETIAPALSAEGSAKEAAVIVACGGLGLRYKNSLMHTPKAGDQSKRDGVSDGLQEKQFLSLAGKPLIAHTLDALEKHALIRLVVLILPEALIGKGEALVRGLWPNGTAKGYPKVRAVRAGGEDRIASVANGLAVLREEFDWQGLVLVQDGVRPCTPASVFDRVIEGAFAKGNAVAAIPLRDTIKSADGEGIVRRTLDRRNLWQIQTPQGFWMRDLEEAYREGRRLGIQATDDAALIEATGRPVYLVQGDPANLKLTYPEDLALLEAIVCGQRESGLR